MRQAPADIRPTLGITHASLSETAALYLVSRSNLRLSFTVRALAHPCIFTQPTYSITNEQLWVRGNSLSICIQVCTNTRYDSTVHTCAASICTYFALRFACHGFAPNVLSHSYTFTKCLQQNEKDYMTVHHWSSTAESSNIAAWGEKKLPLYCIPCVWTSSGCVCVCGLQPLPCCPPPATILS